MSLLKFIDAAKSHGWHHEESGAISETGGWEPNPNAITWGCGHYPTLVRGAVRVAIENIDLYYHNGRAWRGDPTVQPDDRVTLAAIIVDGESRRQGLATAAMKDLQSIAASLGMEINLEVAPMGAFKAKGKRTIGMRSLIRWYKSLGFQPAWPGEGETILIWKGGK